MRNNLVPLSVVVLILLLSGKEKSPDYSKLFPNFVKVNDYTYMDKTEVTNFNWIEYMNWNARNHSKESEQYRNSLPDTTVWTDSLSYNEPYMKYYLRHPAYSHYPVVGITWKQASDLCAWRNDRIHEYIVTEKKTDKAPYYFAYRLPTIEEWKMMYADQAFLSEKIDESGPRKYQGSYRWNTRRNPSDTVGKSENVKRIMNDVTAPVISRSPNVYGVYNVKGNVSEWVLTPNTHIGGSWRTDHFEDVSVPIELKADAAYVGFRCACEVVEEEP